VGDLPTQVALGQLPLLLHGGAKRVLIVGLGSGITASSVASHPKVERIDVLEISPEVVEASGYFADENRRVLEDPRVHLTVADARNFLLAAPDSWDVIVSEPSNPWISGISNLFTREFFELAQSKLAPRGLMTQWFHLYGVSAADVRTVLATFCAVFPEVSVWMPLGGDLVLIGSNEPHRLSYDALQDALAQPTIARDLSRARLAGIAPLARTFLIGGAALDGYVEGAALNTDDRPRIEFGAPRSLYTETALTNLLDLLDHLAGAEQVLPIEGGVRATAGGVLLPPLGLRISGVASDASGTRLEWLLARRAVANGGAHSLRMTSKRRFSWEDGAVEALTVGGRGIDRGQLHQNLGVGGRAVATGDIALMDGRPAAWWRGYDAASGHEQLRLAWACTPEGEILALYTATRRIDAAEQTAQALEDWARRFHCSG
jgi:spermidine synthase